MTVIQLLSHLKLVQRNRTMSYGIHYFGCGLIRYLSITEIWKPYNTFILFNTTGNFKEKLKYGYDKVIFKLFYLDREFFVSGSNEF